MHRAQHAAHGRRAGYGPAAGAPKAPVAAASVDLGGLLLDKVIEVRLSALDALDAADGAVVSPQPAPPAYSDNNPFS